MLEAGWSSQHAATEGHRQRLVSKADPGFAWFKARIDAPNYANVSLRPPDQLFSDRFEIVLPNDVLRSCIV